MEAAVATKAGIENMNQMEPVLMLAVAIPELTETSMLQIENHRRQYDRQFHIVKPHFTLVFPLPEDSGVFAEELRLQLKGASAIPFDVQHASLHEDPRDNTFRAFLVPRQGFRRIVKLHDQLYSGKLSPHLRQDMPYVPHLTIGIDDNRESCQKMISEWNAAAYAMQGIISTVEILTLEGEKATSIEKIKLSYF